MPQNPSLSTPIGNTGISVDPSKAARTALLVAKSVGRKLFGGGGAATQEEINEAMYGGAGPYGTGVEEWERQPNTNPVVSDSANAVTGPIMPGTGTQDEVMHKYWDNLARQRSIDLSGGQEIKRGGRIKRDIGGNAGLKNAINSFSQQRNAQLTGSPESAQQEQMMLAALMNQPRELAVAEPPQQARQPVANQYGDLGDEIERGAKFLEGENPDGEDAGPVAGVPSKGSVVRAATGRGNAVPNGTPTVASLASYIYQQAPKYGIDPNVALGIALREGLNENTVSKGGNKDPGQGWAYGPYQLNTVGLAKGFQKNTGIDPSDPRSQYAQVDYALQFMRDNPSEISNGSHTWYSIRDNGGIGNIAKYGANFAAQNNYFKSAGDQAVQSADNSDYAPPSIEKPDSQGIIKDPNSDGSFTLRDANGNTVGYDRGAASLSSVPYSQPHMASPNSGPPLPPPRPSSPMSQGEGASAGPQAQADPMSNTYDNPLDPNAAPAAARGGKIKRRADGGPAYSSMPTNELIDRALRIIRKHRDSGGGIPAPKSIAQIQQQMQNADTRAAAVALGSDLQNQMSSGIHYAGGESPEAAQYGLYRDQIGFLGAPSSPSTPTAPTAPPDNTPAVKSGTVGNQGTPTGQGIETGPTSGPSSYQPPGSQGTAPTGPTTGIPFATPTGTNGYNYNNTLDQTLGTNNPTMNQIFGFNYPQNLPLPKPQPQGPVSQNEINALYGFGGGSQMGTGTGMLGFQSGGAIIMDALNRARKASKGKR